MKQYEKYLAKCWKEYNYDIEFHDMNTVNPCVFAINENTCICITLQAKWFEKGIRITGVGGNLLGSAFFVPNKLNEVIELTMNYLVEMSLDYKLDRICRSFETTKIKEDNYKRKFIDDENYKREFKFSVIVEDIELTVYPDRIKIDNQELTPEKLNLINRITKTMGW